MIVSNFCALVTNTDGTGVAHPSAIGWYAEEIHGAEICAGLLQDGSHARFAFAVLHEEINALDSRQMTDNFREGPRNGRELIGPVRQFMRPAEPGGFVAFPFGGHAKAELTERFGLWRGLPRGKKYKKKGAAGGKGRGRETRFFIDPRGQAGVVSTECAGFRGSAEFCLVF